MCHLANSLFVGKSSHTGRDILFTEVNNMDQIKTGKFIAYLRKQHNLTQEALGEKLGVTNKTVSRWENANYMPDIEMLQLLSKELNVSVNELLAGEFLSDGMNLRLNFELLLELKFLLSLYQQTQFLL